MPALDPDHAWAQVLARAPDADFVYAVQTTGIYCRPSCASRRPRRDNVAFFADGAAARRQGFRPCKRCRPDDEPEGRRRELVSMWCRLLDHEPIPSLATLAAEAGLSPSQTHRLFKRAVGLTPRAYALARRDERLRDGLASAESVTAAIYEAGFGSSGRFYERSAAMLGMTPGAYRAGAPGLVIRHALGRCSLGAILVALSERGVCAISLGDEGEELIAELRTRFPAADLQPATADLTEAIAGVVALIEEPARGLALPLDIRGTAFQNRVWRALTGIPAGRTASYSDIAAAIGSPSSVRAVAGACAQNPLAVAVPCHRVVRKDGSLSGYRWGIERKRALLARERSDDEGG